MCECAIRFAILLHVSLMVMAAAVSYIIFAQIPSQSAIPPSSSSTTLLFLRVRYRDHSPYLRISQEGENRLCLPFAVEHLSNRGGPGLFLPACSPDFLLYPSPLMSPGHEPGRQMVPGLSLAAAAPAALARFHVSCRGEKVQSPYVPTAAGSTARPGRSSRLAAAGGSLRL